MKTRDLFIGLLLTGCAHGPLGPRSDYGACSLVVTPGKGPSRSIQLANLAFPPAKDLHEGLWCSANALQGLKEFRVDGEFWKIYFWEDDELKVQVTPVTKGARPLLLPIALRENAKGCAGLHQPGEFFRLTGAKTASGISFTVVLNCEP